LIDSDSDSDSDSNSGGFIRSISPPIITLPFKSFARSPPRSPQTGIIPSPIRLAFQKPKDDIPTDSEDEVDPGDLAIRENEFTSIDITANEDLIGMFTDRTLRPHQLWTMGIPTPPDSRGSGSVSPIKDGAGRWDMACTSQDELDVDLEADMEAEIGIVVDTSLGNPTGDHVEGGEGDNLGPGQDMDFDTGLEVGPFNGNVVSVSGRPATPPLSPIPLTANDDVSPSAQLRAQSDTPAQASERDDHPLTPPLPNHMISQLNHQPPLHDAESEDGFQLQSDAEREIAGRLLQTLISNQDDNHLAVSRSTHDAFPGPSSRMDRMDIEEEDVSDRLADWIDGYTDAGSGSSKGKGKGKLVEAITISTMPSKSKPHHEKRQNGSVSHDQTVNHNIACINPQGPSLNSTTSLLSDSSSESAAKASTSADPNHEFTSLLLDITIAQTRSATSQHLASHSIAFTGRPIPFKDKLIELIEGLGGNILDHSQLRALPIGKRYIVHPPGYVRVGKVNGVEHMDVLAFLELVRDKIRGSA
jgi:hypothetical protein